MRIIHSGLVLLFPAFIIFASCQKGSKGSTEKPLARVQDDYLYFSDLSGMLAPAISPEDSSMLVQNFVRNWIKQKLVIRQAEKNLASSQKDFETELAEYRNSLLVYRYESELIRQKLDTTVTDQEIESYYETNQKDFELKDNIVKVIYVKLQNKNVNTARIRNLVRSGRDQDLLLLENICQKHAVNYFLDNQSWLLFNDLLKEIPIRTYDQEAYLQNHRFIEITDQDFTYLVNFSDFKIKESVSPLSFERENIRDIIIHKRKLSLVQEMERKLFENADKTKEYEIF